MTQKDKSMYRNRISALTSRIRKKVETSLLKEDNDEVTNAINKFIQAIQDLVPTECKQHIIDELDKDRQIEQSQDSIEISEEETASIDN